MNSTERGNLTEPWNCPLANNFNITVNYPIWIGGDLMNFQDLLQKQKIFEITSKNNSANFNYTKGSSLIQLSHLNQTEDLGLNGVAKLDSSKPIRDLSPNYEILVMVSNSDSRRRDYIQSTGANLDYGWRKESAMVINEICNLAIDNKISLILPKTFERDIEEIIRYEP